VAAVEEIMVVEEDAVVLLNRDVDVDIVLVLNQGSDLPNCQISLVNARTA
jgi:hypothetical protein